MVQMSAREVMTEIGEYKAELTGPVVITANSTDSIFRNKRQAPGCEGATDTIIYSIIHILCRLLPAR
jgi:hypothetical protein